MNEGVDEQVLTELREVRTTIKWLHRKLDSCVRSPYPPPQREGLVSLHRPSCIEYKILSRPIRFVITCDIIPKISIPTRLSVTSTSVMPSHRVEK